MFTEGVMRMWTVFRWVGGEESASSAFRSNWSGVYMLVGNVPWLIVNFCHLEQLQYGSKLTGIAVCIL